MQAFGFTPLSSDHASHSIWGNMLRAADGDLYIAAGNHEVFGGDSWLYRLPQDGSSIEECLSVRAVIGARSASSSVGEAKIHTRLQQSRDGWIYMATMQGGIGHLTKWSQYAHPRQYEGGHLLRYHPSTGHAESLGIPVAREGLQTMILDVDRELLYLVTWPKKEFVRYDLKTRTTRNFGVIAWSPTTEDGVKQHYARDLFIDRSGRVYCTNEEGNLAFVAPGDDHITDTSFSIRAGDSLRTHVQGADGTVYLCTSQGHLVAFDPADRSVTYLGPTTPELPVYTPNLALREETSSLIYLAGSHGTYAAGGMQLVEFNLNDSSYTVHGYMRGELDPAYCYASAVAADGTVVFAVNGGEPPDSYVVRFDPAQPSAARWLLSEPASTGSGFVFGPGSEGTVPGWIVTEVHPLADESGERVPHDRCAVTALCATADGRVAAGTSAGPGQAGYVVLSGARTPDVQTLISLADLLPSAQRVSGLVAGEDGAFYGGTIDLIDDPRSEPRYAEHPFPSVPAGYSGRQLFRLNPEYGELQSLGTPAAGEGIYAVTVAPDGTGYAFTFPTGRLVEFSTNGGGSPRVVATVLDEACPALRPDEHPLATLEYMSSAVYESRLHQVASHRGISVDTLARDVLLKKAYVSRALVCDAAGRVYGSGPQAGLFRYDPGTGTLERLERGLPIGMGTENGLIAEPSLSAAVLAGDGMIYGGTVQDGYLFRLDPDSGAVQNLGKPTRQGHIRAIAEWAGDIYGLVGEDGGKCHLFRFVRATGSLEDLGVLQGNGRRGFSVNECAALAVCGDRLVIGQSERISTLHSLTRLVYEPYQSP